MRLKIQSTRRQVIIASRLSGKADEPNDQFRNCLLPLLGDKDQEVLEVVTKVEKNNRRKFKRQNPGPERRAMAAPYMGVRCYYCNRPGHIQINCFKQKRDLGGPSGGVSRSWLMVCDNDKNVGNT